MSRQIELIMFSLSGTPFEWGPITIPTYDGYKILEIVLPHVGGIGVWVDHNTSNLPISATIHAAVSELDVQYTNTYPPISAIPEGSEQYINNLVIYTSQYIDEWTPPEQHWYWVHFYLEL